MAETMNYSVESRLGCGFMNVIFQNRFFGQRKNPIKSLLTSCENNSTNPQNTIYKSSNKPLPKIDQKPKINPARNSTSSSSNSSGVRKEALSRASSGNILISSSMGKQNGANIVKGNIFRKNSGNMSQFGNIIRGVSVLDPEVLKKMGNEKHKMGRFGEALALYNQAISLDPNKAVYYSNKGVALIGLGRLAEAVSACREAIKFDPSYHRAHHRLATLYFRLGEPEKAEDHYTQSGLENASDDIANAQTLKRHLSSCKRAMELKDWGSLLKECEHAISLGADSAAQINSMKVDALMNLRKHKEAYEALDKVLDLEIDSHCQLFGVARTAYILTTRAQVYLVVGRYDDALAVAYQATRLDKSYKTNTILKRVEAVALARSNGNHLFKASKFCEAMAEYNEGLRLDPYNSVLLCNRAACRFKSGQFEKAIDDCTRALNVRPCYNKARLRRANCYSKIRKWEAAIEDYKMLVRDAPEDEELVKYLFEARAHINTNTF